MPINPEKSVVIYNPASRGGFVGHHYRELSSRIRGVLGDVRFEATEHSGHAMDIATRESDAGAETIIAFGGDGTVNETVHGIMQSGQRPSLGVLHAGTGGDFRKHLHGSEELETACRAIVQGTARPLDVGRVEFLSHAGQPVNRYFINMASLGLAGLVDRIVGESSKALGGKATYFLSTLKATREYEPARVRVVVDGDDKGVFDINNVCVCNGQYAGGGMRFAPNAKLDDGVFDVIVIRYASTLRSLPVAKGLYSGSHLSSPLVEEYRGEEVLVTLENEHSAYMDVDGEPLGVGPASFTLVPSGLAVYGVRPEFIS